MKNKDGFYVVIPKYQQGDSFKIVPSDNTRVRSAENRQLISAINSRPNITPVLREKIRKEVILTRSKKSPKKKVPRGAIRNHINKYDPVYAVGATVALTADNISQDKAPSFWNAIPGGSAAWSVADAIRLNVAEPYVLEPVSEGFKFLLKSLMNGMNTNGAGMYSFNPQLQAFYNTVDKDELAGKAMSMTVPSRLFGTAKSIILGNPKAPWNPENPGFSGDATTDLGLDLLSLKLLGKTKPSTNLQLKTLSEVNPAKAAEYKARGINPDMIKVSEDGTIDLSGITSEEAILSLNNPIRSTINPNRLSNRELFSVKDYGSEPIYTRETAPTRVKVTENDITESHMNDGTPGSEVTDANKLANDWFNEAPHGLVVSYESDYALSSDSYPLSLLKMHRWEKQGLGQFVESEKAPQWIRLNKLGNKSFEELQLAIDRVNKLTGKNYKIEKRLSPILGRNNQPVLNPITRLPLQTTGIYIQPVSFFKYKKGNKICTKIMNDD